MADKMNEYKTRIPEYLTGQLDQNEKERVEQLIHDDPESAKEFETFSRIKDSYETLPDAIPSPPADAFSKIMEHVDEYEASQAAPENKLFLKDMAVHFLSILRSWFAMPQTGWAMAAVQAVIILIMVVTLSTGPRENAYQTLSTGPVTGVTGMENSVRINVVFNETATEKEIRMLLNDLQVNIVSGPSLTGRYILTVDETGNVPAVLEKMKRASVIKFAQTCVESTQ